LALALYRPGWCFLLFIGTIPLENIDLAPPQLGIAIRPYQFFGALAILAIIIRLASQRLHFKLIKPVWYDWLVIILVLGGFLSIIAAPDKISSFRLSIIIGTFAALYYLVRNYIQNIEDLKKAIPFFLSSSVIVVSYGIWQNWAYLHNLASFEVMPGRANATFTEPDWLGIYLVLLTGIAYTLIYYFQLENGDTSKRIFNFQFSIYKFQIFNYLLLTATFILLIITVSRSAWLGAFAVYAIFVSIFFIGSREERWKWKETAKLKLKIISCLLISILLVYVFHLTNFQLFNRAESTGTGLQKITISCDQNINLPEKIQNVSELGKYNCRFIKLEEIQSEKDQGKFVTEIYRSDPNVQTRSEIYQKSWEQIRNHPILGIGWGSIGDILGKDERGAVLNSSNIFLETYLGAGILGFLALVILLGYILIKSIKNYFYAENDLQKVINLFIIISWFAIIIPNLFNTGIFLGIFWVWIAVAQVKS